MGIGSALPLVISILTLKKQSVVKIINIKNIKFLFINSNLSTFFKNKLKF